MSKQATPLGERILATAEPVAEQKKGSIYIPSIVTDSEPLAFYKVISAGHKCEVVKPNDRIIAPKSAATRLNTVTDDEEIFIIMEGNVIAID